MDTSIATAVTDILRTLPPDPAKRQPIVQRLTEMCAAAEAASALRTAAVRAQETIRQTAPGSAAGPSAQLLATVLSSVSALWEGAAIQTGAAGRALPTAPSEAARLMSFASEAGEEISARDRLASAVGSPALAAIVRSWTSELRQIAVERPSTGACTVATALKLWNWTAHHWAQDRTVNVRSVAAPLDIRAGELAEAFCWLAAARCQIVETAHDAHAALAAVTGAREFFSDLCHVQAARSAGAAATICAELVFGYRQHPKWDAEGCAACYHAEDLDALECVIPGISSSMPPQIDVIEADGSHAAKAGPCARFDGLETFMRLRTRLDACLTGARLTKDRAAEALPRVLTAVSAIG